MISNFRLPFLVLAILCLLLGLATGLSRMGWEMKMVNTSLHHGAIMVGGFLGTLISLEKVIPLKRKGLYLIPALSGLSVALFLADLRTEAFLLLVLASFSLSCVFLYYLVRTRDVIYFLMSCGAMCWLAGNLVLANRTFYPAAFPWWIGFLLFVITAERLELTKFLPVRPLLKNLLIGFLFLYAAGVIISFHSFGHWVSGAALIAVAIWLMQYDLIGISIKKSGLPKFIAIALLSGYTAMLFTGVFLMTLMQSAFGYDAILHTFFLGFAFSMIFAHGPVILPGVLGISAKPWHPVMYLWLALLLSSLVARVVADLSMHMVLRKFTGLASTIAILGYFATMAVLTIKHHRPHAKVL